jgi:hypothetical protein
MCCQLLFDSLFKYCTIDWCCHVAHFLTLQDLTSYTRANGLQAAQSDRASEQTPLTFAACHLTLAKDERFFSPQLVFGNRHRWGRLSPVYG